MRAVLVFLLALGRWQATGQTPPPPETPLAPTVHAALPQNVDEYWFAPRPADFAVARNRALADAAAAYGAGNYSLSLTYARQAVAAGGPLDAYALTLLRWGGFAGHDPQGFPALWALVQRVAALPAVARAIERERLQLNVYKPV